MQSRDVASAELSRVDVAAPSAQPRLGEARRGIAERIGSTIETADRSRNGGLGVGGEVVG